MVKSRKQKNHDFLMLEAKEILERLVVGSWIPNVDICDISVAIRVQVELPGVDPDDIRVTIQGSVLRVHGAKREAGSARDRLSYYCLERRYGKFDRSIGIDKTVDAARSKASLANGILTIVIPKIEERRGKLFEIPIESVPE